MKRTLLILTLIALLGASAFGVRAWLAQRGNAEQPQAGETEEPVDDRLVAEGKVVPVQHAVLSLSTGGIVSAVRVAEGERVAAGQVLLQLDPARAAAAVAQAEAVLAQAEAVYERLRAGATPEEISVAEAQLRASEGQLQQANGSVTRADRAAAEAELAQAQAHLAELLAGPKSTDTRAARALLAQAQANLAAQRDQLSAAKTSAQLQMEQRVSDLTRAQSAYATALQNWQYVQDRGKDPLNESVDPATGKRTRPSLNDPQQQQYYDAYVQAEAAMRTAEAAVQQAQVAYDTARQTEVSGVQLAEQQVASGQAGFDKVRAGADADVIAAARAHVAGSRASLDKLGGEQRGGTIASAQALVEEAQANLNRLRAGASERDLAVGRAEVQRAQAALKLAQVALEETELRAPFSGVVAMLDLKVGEFVAPGAPSVHVADLASWQIETTDLTELDIVRVRAGSLVSMTFDAIPGLELPGTVSRIRVLGENRQGDITYVITIMPDRQDERLHWNMTAAMSIAPS